jgi:hypothetical protein
MYLIQRKKCINVLKNVCVWHCNFEKQIRYDWDGSKAENSDCKYDVWMKTFYLQGKNARSGCSFKICLLFYFILIVFIGICALDVSLDAQDCILMRKDWWPVSWCPSELEKLRPKRPPLLQHWILERDYESAPAITGGRVQGANKVWYFILHEYFGWYLFYIGWICARKRSKLNLKTYF